MIIPRLLSRASLAALCLAAILLPSAFAAPLQAPAGAPILTVTGNIGHTTDGTHAYFDRAMLEALGTVTIETSTPWTEGVGRFEGVPVRRVLEAVQARNGRFVFALARNDYGVEIPVSDFVNHDVILAIKQNGRYLSGRDKGPILVIYPFDDEPALRTEAIYDRSVWQLTRIEVR